MWLNGARAILRLFPGIEDVAASVVLEVDEAVPAVAEVDVDRGLVAGAAEGAGVDAEDVQASVVDDREVLHETFWHVLDLNSVQGKVQWGGEHQEWLDDHAGGAVQVGTYGNE